MSESRARPPVATAGGTSGKVSAAAAAPAASRRGPRRAGARAMAPALSREAIVAAALAVVEAEGLAALSARKIGQRLHCEAMSIYHHLPSKQHLLDALVDQAIASFAWPDPALPPLARLRAAMFAYREMARRQPALYPLVGVHRLNTPTGVAFIEGVLQLVRAVVPDEETAARHFRVIGYYLMGACLDETSGYAKGPSAAEPVSDEYIVRECPNLARAARFFQPAEWTRTFELGVDALLAAVERDAAFSCKVRPVPRNQSGRSLR